jgi:alkanesulfonate monooxygenase SsuD/methylene tetrahydromethanopterin reductase-like flavin-dependent oxidoreductase (luciferase family)
VTVAPEYSTNSGPALPNQPDRARGGAGRHPPGVIRLRGSGRAAAGGGLTGEAARGRLGHSLTGTPGQVRERLRALADAGVGGVFLLFDDLPRLAGLRSFAEAVIPALHSGGDEGAEPP